MRILGIAAVALMGLKACGKADIATLEGQVDCVDVDEVETLLLSAAMELNEGGSVASVTVTGELDGESLGPVELSEDLLASFAPTWAAQVVAADLGLLCSELEGACWDFEAVGGDGSVRSRPVGDCF